MESEHFIMYTEVSGKYFFHSKNMVLLHSFIIYSNIFFKLLFILPLKIFAFIPFDVIKLLTMGGILVLVISFQYNEII